MARKKAWGGRFSTETHKQVEAFTASIDFDRRLAPYDIAGSIAHARMLAKCGILTKAEADSIVGGLEEIREEIARGDFRYDHALEDIHMHVERRRREAAYRSEPERPGGAGSASLSAGRDRRHP
jgi:argininosuccinate lyase